MLNFSASVRSKLVGIYHLVVNVRQAVEELLSAFSRKIEKLAKEQWRNPAENSQ